MSATCPGPQGQWLLRWRAAWAIVRAELSLGRPLRRYAANPSDFTWGFWEEARERAAESRCLAWASLGRGPTGQPPDELAAQAPGLDLELWAERETQRRLAAWRADCFCGALGDPAL